MEALLAFVLSCMASERSDQAGREEVRHASPVLCATCHSNAPGAYAMRDASGKGIAPFDLWDGTVMANAASDPFFLAVLSVERATTAAGDGAVDSLCFRCHDPVAAPGEAGDAIAAASGEGVSCTVCHQIVDRGLGTPASYSGGFRFGTAGEIYGPHRDVMPMPMLHHTGFRPTYASHVTRSALCATCHTLLTEALTADGEAAGDVLPEQTPYLEWRNSIYNDEPGQTAAEPRGCADCHLPVRETDGSAIRTAIARNPHGRDFGFAPPRSPFGVHSMRGSNRMLSKLDDRFAPAADPHGFDEPAATVEIGAPEMAGRTVEFDVGVRNRTGHKFPTGHPSRRAWLRIVIRDRAGAVLFGSGSFDGGGRIVDGGGAPLPIETAGGPAPVHRDRVRSPSDVPIYEAVMADGAGRPTWLLLRGVRFAKDDRLLPRGWSADHPDAESTMPRGTGKDADFAAGVDVVHYRVELPRGVEVGAIQAELLYQTWGARYLAEVSRHDTPEMRAFLELYDPVDKTPRVIASARREVGPIEARSTGR